MTVGSLRLTFVRIITIQVSDINDNPPIFERSFYDIQLQENNIPGLLIGSVQAVDLDTEQNAQVTYSFLPGKVRDVPVSSYISINSETGNLYAIQSIDYENIKEFDVTIYQMNSTSPSNDLVPRGADADYLVTKVVAVDIDSGQNSWLSYHLLKATETDNGHSPLSTTTTLQILLVDGFSDPYMKMMDIPKEEAVEEEDSVNSQDISSHPEENKCISQEKLIIKKTTYAVNIRAVHREGAYIFCKVIVEVEDENNNALEATIVSIIDPLPEDSPSVHIMDENNKAPFILSPLQNSTVPSNDSMSHGADTGYFITKVVAMDRDSGQNSWLLSQLLKATEPGLFTVGTKMEK
ncbi:hypothetical protein JD844_017136 [Phrynosoma platyrhinos]|uniref:Cadherin domain-containing protein n=1 Tax=Phrynosoma platyrhinos TaxID=52577 RepID=A0ABQ7SLD4_PHRPL|nr:hypothetical protein JD844_017136 [Phrynosoma platyrhinos]